MAQEVGSLSIPGGYPRINRDLERCQTELTEALKRASTAQGRFQELITAQETAERDRLAYLLLTKHLQEQIDQLRRTNEDLKRKLSNVKNPPNEEESGEQESGTNGG